MHTHSDSLVLLGEPMPENDKTRGLVLDRMNAEKETRTGQPTAENLTPLLTHMKNKFGDDLLAILIYGSWLRGKRDTMLDFYVLLEDYRSLDSFWQAWMCRLLPPNVYHVHHQAGGPADGGHDTRAKIALLTLDRFHRATQRDFHSYFWARFAQPCEILYVRDEATRATLAGAFTNASASFVQRVLPALPSQFNSRELWTEGFSLSYRCELRTESSLRATELYEFNPDWYDKISNTLALDGAAFSAAEKQTQLFTNQSSPMARKLSPLGWWLRRIQGKLLSVLRLVKAAFTFNEPLEYLLWKIERHTGVYIEPTARQLKHPLIFAWPLLWKLYRRGAFR